MELPMCAIRWRRIVCILEFEIADGSWVVTSLRWSWLWRSLQPRLTTLCHPRASLGIDVYGVHVISLACASSSILLHSRGPFIKAANVKKILPTVSRTLLFDQADGTAWKLLQSVCNPICKSWRPAELCRTIGTHGARISDISRFFFRVAFLFNAASN